jgi:hypothetical protein
MTIAHDNGDLATNGNGNGFNGRVRTLSVIALAFLVSWFVVCAVTGTDSSNIQRNNFMVVYSLPKTNQAPLSAPALRKTP